MLLTPLQHQNQNQNSDAKHDHGNQGGQDPSLGGKDRNLWNFFGSFQAAIAAGEGFCSNRKVGCGSGYCSIVPSMGGMLNISAGTRPFVLLGILLLPRAIRVRRILRYLLGPCFSAVCAGKGLHSDRQVGCGSGCCSIIPSMGGMLNISAGTRPFVLLGILLLPRAIRVRRILRYLLGPCFSAVCAGKGLHSGRQVGFRTSDSSRIPIVQAGEDLMTLAALLLVSGCIHRHRFPVCMLAYHIDGCLNRRPGDLLTVAIRLRDIQRQGSNRSNSRRIGDLKLQKNQLSRCRLRRGCDPYHSIGLRIQAWTGLIPPLEEGSVLCLFQGQKRRVIRKRNDERSQSGVPC